MIHNGKTVFRCCTNIQLAAEDCLKSRMWKNRAYGSVRGSDIPSQVEIVKGVSSCLLD